VCADINMNSLGLVAAIKLNAVLFGGGEGRGGLRGMYFIMSHPVYSEYSAHTFVRMNYYYFFYLFQIVFTK